MKKINVILLFVSALCFVSCDSVTYDQISEVNTNPTYAANVGPVFHSNCSGCHNSGGQYPSLANYTEVKDAVENGNVICRIDTQTCGSVMPTSGRMNQGTIDMIKLWATNGYPN
ncbi:hypothetical protein [Flavobacterium restrictum]|uniref:Cytochrome c domain-containing protein n=1 Tax=Flavobacterium restrictum TaxID=2594428 RepID=A0A553E8R4_9FLAO|nr:hypothetical protein [Flavobacterium restrictum]TRX41301.1 hypothetical protein FNW21_04170 [Flavobacterium restrictum]